MNIISLEERKTPFVKNPSQSEEKKWWLAKFSIGPIFDYCFPRNPINSHREIRILPSSMTFYIYSSMERSALKKEKVLDPSSNKKLQKIVHKVFSNLIKQIEKNELTLIEYRCTITDSKQIQAFANPNGNVFIDKAILKKINKYHVTNLHLSYEDKVASILSHEIAHIALNHHRKKMELGITTYIFSCFVFYNIFNTFLESDPSSLGVVKDISVFAISLLLTVPLLLAYCRKQEYEADEYGIRFMQSAGYNLKASLYLQKLLLKIRSQLPKENSIYSFFGHLLSDHPLPKNRLEANKKTIKSLKKAHSY